MKSATQSQSYSKYNHPEWRNVFPLPLADKFYNLLQDRLHSAVENILFQGDTRFTLLINAISRKETQRYSRKESPAFIYAGLASQEDLLERGAKTRWGKTPGVGKKIETAWTYLAQTKIVQENSEVSKSYYELIKNGKLDLTGTCKIQRLKEDYFDKGTATYTEEMKAEKRILGNYFDLDQDLFISVPLFGFAEFDGVVHIIFKNDMLGLIDDNLPELMANILSGLPNAATFEELLVPKRIMWSLLRAFILEYDGLFLDWDMEGENVEKISAINEFVISTILSEGEDFDRATGLGGPTVIIHQLRLQEYYQQHRDYFKTRLEAGADVPGKIYQQYITHAVSSILVDSYAHNVSAHALSTLAWWYYRRAKLLRDEELDWDALFAFLQKDEDIDPKLLKDFANVIDTRRATRLQRDNQHSSDVPKENIRVEDGEKVIRYPGSLAREIAQLLRFLTEKGAYWSGVARDANVGGKVSTLYSILWYDFINNPFYVGTIAKTEDILKIHLRIVLYEPETETERTNNTLFHDKFFKPENAGIFATVDLSSPRPEFTSAKAKSHDDTLSAFVHKGDKFDYFKEKLKSKKIFFPGGIVGRHAFFTMIENEIRNVKHYNREELRTLQMDGLTIAIGIQECSLHGSSNKEIYRFSIWLDIPTRLGEDKNHLMLRKWEMLKGDIIAPVTRAPRLGGSFQDKVCSGFLFNGFFSHVQRGDKNPDRDNRSDTPRDENYFPWIRPACSTVHQEIRNGHRDYKISFNNPTKVVTIPDPNDPENDFITEIRPEVSPDLPKIGHTKKVFYLWRGENLMDWSTQEKLEGAEASWDNPARYTLVNLDTPNSETLEVLRRERGVVRIVHGIDKVTDDEARYISAYAQWLSILLKGEMTAFRLRERDEESEVGQAFYQFVLDPRSKSAAFYHYPVGSSLTGKALEVDQVAKNLTLTLDIVHKGDTIYSRDSEARYRNHGIFKSHFFPTDFNALDENQKTYRMLEMFEVLTTRICIFDNRIQHRLRIDEKATNGESKKNSPYKLMLRDRLNLGIYNEAMDPQASHSDAIPSWLSTLDEDDRKYVKNCHFLVMHLSFIESILDREVGRSNAGNVGFFIEKYIIPFVGMRDNFFLVITTGRGRREWWGTVGQEAYKEKGYTKFVLFRPVESLLAVVENSINMLDDIELKYRVTKVLYGA